ncbi:hypothetical protein BABA_14477 [Neobacillus bataviensis LMG 21833]|uniref:Uncharacterized protein n=1 Tax=Neobacillus bataviensis LMG 21833 TaxID=1117379 RepID=K6E0I7_9BACI|nr:hypothetical protein [Neobacillus bataviensis]EKN66671.1 hypothetical protein BABA_14477 [Neobacillus bataviensis LMG 21833]
MSSILLIGLIGVILVMFLKNPIISTLGDNNKVVRNLRSTKWFQNHWVTGIFLFFMNGVLFFSTCLILFVFMHFMIPYIHLLVMFLAVIGSIFLWMLINNAWQGTRRNRLKMGVVGSSFYIFLTIIFIYMFLSLKPSYPGEDTFMRAFGILFAIIVTTAAFITCFVITGFSRRKI